MLAHNQDIEAEASHPVIVYPQHLIGPILIGVAVVVGGLLLLWMIFGFLGIGIASLVRGRQRQDNE